MARKASVMLLTFPSVILQQLKHILFNRIDAIHDSNPKTTPPPADWIRYRCHLHAMSCQPEQVFTYPTDLKEDSTCIRCSEQWISNTDHKETTFIWDTLQVSVKVRLTKYGTLIYTSPNNIVLLLVPHHYLIFLALCTVYFNLDNYTYGALLPI